MADDGFVVVLGPDTERRTVLQRLVTASGYAAIAVPGYVVREPVSGPCPIAVLVDVTCLAPDEAVLLVGTLRRDVGGPLIGVVNSHDDDTCPALLDAGADDVVRGSIAAPELRARLYAHSRPRHAGPRRTSAG